MTAELDHLVVAARTLDDGVRWCEATFGVTPGPGGRHPLMGTHNRLLNVSGSSFRRCYLEIIAIDPEAPAPGRARWYGLDDDPAAGGPRLIHVAARSATLDADLAALRALGLDVGVPVAASRGALNWRIVVRDDGALVAGGVLPTLIEWGDAHPTDTLAFSGVALHSVRLNGLDARARDVLALPGVIVAPQSAPSLVAELQTSMGTVRLYS